MEIVSHVIIIMILLKQIMDKEKKSFYILIMILLQKYMVVILNGQNQNIKSYNVLIEEDYIYENLFDI